MNENTCVYLKGGPRQVVGATPNGRDFQMDIFTGDVESPTLIATVHGATEKEADDNAHRIMAAINVYGNAKTESMAKKLKTYEFSLQGDWCGGLKLVAAFTKEEAEVMDNKEEGERSGYLWKLHKARPDILTTKKKPHIMAAMSYRE